MRRVVVIIRVSDPARVAEALRAAVGLSLRGDGIQVVIGDAAQETAHAAAHPGIRRGLATLATLGHELAWGDAAIAAALGRADAVEVWS